MTMADDTALMSTPSSVLEDVTTSNDNDTGDFVSDVSTNIWRYGWPPLCMMGLVGNTGNSCSCRGGTDSYGRRSTST